MKRRNMEYSPKLAMEAHARYLSNLRQDRIAGRHFARHSLNRRLLARGIRRARLVLSLWESGDMTDVDFARAVGATY